MDGDRENRRLDGDTDSSNMMMDKGMASFVEKQRHEIVPYEHDSGSSEAVSRSPVAKKKDTVSARKLASTIITPSRLDHPMEENVTVRQRGEPLPINFSPSTDKEPMNTDEEIIGALDDMEILEQQDGEMMEAEI